MKQCRLTKAVSRCLLTRFNYRTVELGFVVNKVTLVHNDYKKSITTPLNLHVYLTWGTVGQYVIMLDRGTLFDPTTWAGVV